MKRFKLESTLMPFVATYLKAIGYDAQQPEVQFYDRRIDLLGLSKDNKKIIAVELKLHKWRKAFQQALLYQLCSDFVLVAVPAENSDRIKLDCFRRHGIGVLQIFSNGKKKIISEPVQSHVTNTGYKQRYTEFLRECRHESNR